MASHTYSYQSPLNSNLVCCICQSAFLDPVTTRTCSHTFCHACVTHAMTISSQCPVDRSPLALRDLTPASQVVRNMVDELIVECPYRDAGCRHACQRYLLDTHLRVECGYTQIPCPSGGCDRTLLRKDVSMHQCIPRTEICDSCGCAVDAEDEQIHPHMCTATMSACVTCAISLPRDLFSDHLTICPTATVGCPHASYGCAWSGSREMLESSHSPSCAYESLKGFFRIHDNQLSALTEENARLRHNIDALEGLVAIMRREMEAVKAALGPWYRQDDDTIPHPSSARPAATYPPSDASQLPADLFLENSTTPVVPSSDADLLAPFFASLSLNAPTHSSSSPLQPPQPNPHTPPVRPFFQDAFSPRGPPPAPGPLYPATAHVAPLDLGAPLPDTLAGLRGSVIALAGALDSAARHADIALAADAARAGEELAALKAVVHGLRLQVHSLMLDRNAQITGRFAVGTEGQGSSTSSMPAAPPVRYIGYPFPRHPHALPLGPMSPPTSTKL